MVPRAKRLCTVNKAWSKDTWTLCGGDSVAALLVFSLLELLNSRPIQATPCLSFFLAGVARADNFVQKYTEQP